MMTEAERQEMLMQVRQTRLRFTKVCEDATEAIQGLIAAWNEGRTMVSLAQIRSGEVSGDPA